MNYLFGVIFVLTLFSLLAALSKERLAERSSSKVPTVRRVHFVLVFLIAILTLVMSLNYEGRFEMQKKKEATIAATKHIIPIQDHIFLELLPSSITLTNYIQYTESMKLLEGTIQEKFIWEKRASPQLILERDRGLAAFKEIQKIAREIIGEQIIYGKYYPAAMAKWAEHTLNLTQYDIPNLFRHTDEAAQYGELIGVAIGESVKTLKQME
jgi:hypothetical protein